MPWLQLKIQTTRQHVDAISTLLTSLGALSVTWQDAANQPLFEPPPGQTPLWSDTLITGLYEAGQDMQQIGRLIEASLGNIVNHLRVEILEDKDWVREWMEHYAPMQFGQDLWIVPSHHTPPRPDAVNILLDPGLAFGTGTHPTTAMCLTWLATHPPTGKQVTDYGCGSGILASRAAKPGANELYAVDNAAQASLATLDNARQNGGDAIILVMGVHDEPVPDCDVLVANILSGPLQILAKAFSEILRPGGKIALSGILKEQADDVMHAYAPWFNLQISQQQEEWVLLTGQRHAH